MSRRDGVDGALELTLALRYRHRLGALAPYFAALAQGRALASRCRRSACVSFPPQDAHLDGGGDAVELSGAGRIVALTRGPARLPLGDAVDEACFALIAMDGADNLCFGRIDERGATLAVGDRVRLAPTGVEAPHPAQSACFVPEDGGRTP